MYSVDADVMRFATEWVQREAVWFYEVHTVTIVMNDGSPQFTMKGFTSDQLDEHLTLTYWKAETTRSYD